MNSQDYYSEEFLRACEEMSIAYDAFLETIIEEDEIGYCGFLCDGECQICKRSETFNLEDEY